MENRSAFVTVLAWIFIAIGGFGTLISIAQSVMLHTLFPEDATSSMPEDTPAIFAFMFDNFHLFFYGMWIICGVTFISAIGLLLRKNWARIVFIVLMGLGIAWQFIGLGLQFVMFDSFPEMPAVDGAPEMETIKTFFIVFSMLIGIGLAVLCGWIIKKLATSPIKEEFAT